MTVRAIRIGMTSHDPGRLSAFYRDAFGFKPAPSVHDDELVLALGVRTGTADILPMQLGQQTVELAAFSPPGRPYPARIAANDLRFQHFAIVVTDIAAAVTQLTSVSGWTAISQGGPQRLPQSSGGATAFKFRDCDGHPLELLEFTGGVPERWRHRRAEPCLGIDHSAITVADTPRSVAFYRDLLGLSVGGATSLNRGPEQERLDSVTDPVVEVTSLRTAASDGIGIELLHYAQSVAGSGPVEPTDVAATRLLLETDNPDEIAVGLVRFGGSRLHGTPGGRPGGGFAARDPDGHLLLFVPT